MLVNFKKEIIEKIEKEKIDALNKIAKKKGLKFSNFQDLKKHLFNKKRK